MSRDADKTYPRLLNCHPLEIDSMRRTMFVQGYLSAKKVHLVIKNGDQKELKRLHREANRAFDTFTKAMGQLHEEMLKKAAETKP